MCANIIRQRHHWQNNTPTRSGTATFPHSVPRRAGTNMGGEGKCINVQIAFIKLCHTASGLLVKKFMLCRGASLSWCMRRNLTFICQTLCPAQMQLFVSFHLLKCVSSDKPRLDGVQHSWALMTLKKEGKKGTIIIFFYLCITENKPETRRMKLTLYSRH